MVEQTWSDFLASLGVTWAAGCNFEHGQPPLGNDPAYTVIGQNLYANTVDNITAGVQAWYDEKVDYNYDTLTCAANKVCGHYTQVQHPCPYCFHYYHRRKLYSKRASVHFRSQVHLVKTIIFAHILAIGGDELCTGRAKK